MTYTPIVNDYIKWRDVEGWVYFVGEQYCTIEIGVKCKDSENIKDCPIHEKVHCLVVCYTQHWNEIEYVKSRPSKHDNGCIDTYKSQEYRYQDP